MLRFRETVSDDLAAIRPWVAAPASLVQWAGPVLFHHPLTPEQWRSYLVTAAGTAPSAVILTGVDGAGAAPVVLGEIGMINRDQRTASLCRIIVDPARRGEGLCRALVGELLRRGFGELGLRRIDLRVYAHNSAAERCYTTAGFVREGVLRQATLVDGMLWDVVLMGLLREEWQRTNTTER